MDYKSLLQIPWDWSWKCRGRNDLKERFLTQSDPDIHSKLLKEGYAPTFLDNQLRLAQTLCYGREEEEKRQKKTKEDWSPSSSSQINSETARKKCRQGPKQKGTALLLLKKVATLGRVALRHLNRHCLHAQSADIRARECCSLRPRPQGSDSQGNQDWRCLGLPTQAPVIIPPEERSVMTTVGANQSISS